MKKEDNFQEFRIMDEVSRDGDLTQRNLSQRLGMALGLINLYVKRLIKKGFIKVINIKPNRLRYELTPSGIAQKTTLAFQYIQDSYLLYREARKNLAKNLQQIKGNGGKAVVLFGTGEIAEIAILSIQEVGLDLVGIVDLDPAGKLLCGKPVYPLGSLCSMNFDRIIVFERDRHHATKLIGEFGIEESRIVSVGY